MSPLVAEIIDGFLAQGWKSDPYSRFDELVFGYRELIGELLSEASVRWVKNSTFFDDVISFASREDIALALPSALRIVETGGNPACAESLIARCSQQFPGVLHGYLDRIFAAKPNGSTYYAAWPWRESAETHLTFLSDAVRNGCSADRELALAAMGEIRTPLALDLMCAGRTRGRVSADDWCRTFGYERRSGLLRPLFVAQPFHLVFSPAYFASIPPMAAHLRRNHPTWSASRMNDSRNRFGGEGESMCSACGRPNHHLLSFETAASGGLVRSRPKLVMETCLSCLGWAKSPLFYEHDDRGRPREYGRSRHHAEPEFPAVGLRETEVAISAADRRWFWQDWALSNGRQNLNRIGGFPSWIQDAEYPDCPKCGSVMQFLLQLDSNLPTAEGEEWLWGSGGICYGFWCDQCAISAFNWQCT